MPDTRITPRSQIALRRGAVAVSVAAIAATGLATLATSAGAATSASRAADSARPAAPSATIAPQAAGDSATYWTATRLAQAAGADLVVSKATKARLAKEAPQSGKPGRVAGTGAVAAAAGVRPHGISSAVNWWGSLSSPPATTTGRVFFSKYTAGGTFIGNYSCSGGLVNSEGKDMVFTAGHCVHGGAGYGYHRNWIFVPGYRNGVRPQGTWYPKRLQTLTGWSNSSDFTYDLGVGLLYADSLGRQAVNRFGGQGIQWNYSRGYYAYDFGYPADPPFNGSTLKVCTDDTFTDVFDTTNLGINCNMTGGSSGGPWLRSFGGTYGYVNGVNSYKYDSYPGNIYSPYFGNGAANLYNANRYL